MSIKMFEIILEKNDAVLVSLAKGNNDCICYDS